MSLEESRAAILLGGTVRGFTLLPRRGQGHRPSLIDRGQQRGVLPSPDVAGALHLTVWGAIVCDHCHSVAPVQSLGSMPDFLAVLFSSGAALTTTVAFIATLVGAVTALRKEKSVAFDFSVGGVTLKEVATAEGAAQKDITPFETTALANYYNQALSRARVSFWFSLVFASLGFGVIIFAFITHSAGDVAGTIVKVASGTIIDAVSSLFFIQSNAAQKAMGEFFEKLRLDRLNAEARDMIREIEASGMRDELRAQLILKYSGSDRLLAGGSGSGQRDL